MINSSKDDSEDSQFPPDLSCCDGVVMVTESRSRRSGLREWEAAPAWTVDTQMGAQCDPETEREDTEWARVSALSLNIDCLCKARRKYVFMGEERL